MGPAGAIFMDKVCRIGTDGAPSTLDTDTHGQPGSWSTREMSHDYIQHVTLCKTKRIMKKLGGNLVLLVWYQLLFMCYSTEEDLLSQEHFHHNSQGLKTKKPNMTITL